MSELYIGLMSGTSLDGVDGVLADFSQPLPRILAFASQTFEADLRQQLLSLNQSGANELHRAALAANQLALVYASVVNELLRQSEIRPDQVHAVGAHGQTVRHQPGQFDGIGYTLQLNQPALLAEQCGITVVADFRSRDIAAGGQGAPLVPPFHQAVFGASATIRNGTGGADGTDGPYLADLADLADLPDGPEGTTALLNLGGISNLTLFHAQRQDSLIGFDCGPGNVLLDTWCQQHTGAAYDAAGAWAASGKVITALLSRWYADAYFSRPPPKSTGRDLFNREWLDTGLRGFESVAPQDVQATLAELTAQCCAESLERFAPHCGQLLVCGGGAHNLHLMQRLQQLLPHCQVSDTGRYGIPPTQVEATAFAWLARQTMLGRPGNNSRVTGARGPRILGAVYPR